MYYIVDDVIKYIRNYLILIPVPAKMTSPGPGRTRPKDNRLCVRILQAPPPPVSNVTCVCAMPVLFITHRLLRIEL